MSGDEIILKVEELRTSFYTEEGVVRAVDGVSFELAAGETLGIVGESGSGKSVSQLTLMGLIPMPPGRIEGGTAHYKGQDLLKMSKSELRKIRGNKISMIFQDPMTSLNPFLKVSTQLCEVLQLHQGVTKAVARKRAVEMLRKVGIPGPEARLDQYPHQFSGGMRQRVMIAMALMCNPELLIADEPTTALDVTIQAQILELIKDLSKDFGTSVILITHDLGVVAGMSDRIIVMYGGRIMEEAPTRELFKSPSHPYTLGLLRSIPRLDDDAHERLVPIHGLPPNLADLPGGCPFHPRCPFVEDRCKETFPERHAVNEEHGVFCWRSEEVSEMYARGETDAILEAASSGEVS